MPRAAFEAQTGQRMLASALEQARLADAVGFDYVSVSEHHFAPAHVLAERRGAVGALSQVVASAHIAWLGPLVSVNNPLRAAEEVAMLDQLTGGRLIVLPLRGTPNEHTVYNNIDPATSRSRTEEARLLIRKALTETEPCAWKGENFDFPLVSIWPGRTQVPHPPLYSSGNSRDSVDFAARNKFPIAISFYDTAAVAELTSQIRAQARIALGATDAEADEIREKFLPRGAGRPRRRPFRHLVSASGRCKFCGGPDTVVEQIRAFHEATGVGILDLSFGRASQDLTLAAIRRFGQQVLPKIQDLAARAA